jgi:hypothetical protein
MHDALYIALIAGAPGVIAAMVAGYIAVIKSNLAARERSRAQSFREISHEAVAAVETVAKMTSVNPDVPLVPAIAAVVPEHNSPTTVKQVEDAELQTLRARLVAATLATGLPARKSAPMENGSSMETK